MTKLDKRRKYYLVLDCETATLPYSKKFDDQPILKRKIATAKPLIYDLGWAIVDRRGKTYQRKNFLITEIFSVPEIFNTAYYRDKKSIYLEKLRKGEIILVNWDTAIKELESDLASVECVGAYNAMFDYKKAIPFTEKYIEMLYSPDYYKWIENQNSACEKIVANCRENHNKNFDSKNFILRGNKYPLFDIWGLACKYMINNDEYKQMCIENGWITASGKYFKTSAETTFSYYSKNTNFIESHTAIDDVNIEVKIFSNIVKRTLKNLEIGLTYFPFRELGTVEIFENKKMNGE